jgi:hypothetical protein
MAERQIPDRVAVGTDPLGNENETSIALRGAGFVYDRVSVRMLAGASSRGGELTVGAAR